MTDIKQGQDGPMQLRADKHKCGAHLRRVHGIQYLLQDIPLDLVLQPFDGLLHTIFAGLQQQEHSIQK